MTPPRPAVPQPLRTDRARTRLGHRCTTAGLTLALAAAVLPLAGAAEPRTFAVAPAGDDANPGTRAAPFRTVGRARDAVRGLEPATAADTVVEIAAGTYELAEPLTFGPADSGRNDHPVTYRATPPGATVVLSGGRRVGGWEPDADGCVRARVEVANFRQLYVNGRRAQRARGTPPAGLEPWGVHQATIRPAPGQTQVGSVEVTAPAGFTTTDARLAEWRNPGDLELGFYNAWTHMICRVERIERDGNGARITMLQPGFFLACRKGGTQAGRPDYVENARELLDEPGEWYLDRRAHILYYRPRPDEDVGRAEVVAPMLTTLLEVRGTLDQPVHDIRFEGLTFAHATWLRPSEFGHPDGQANFIATPDNGYQRPEHERGFVPLNGEFGKSPANVVVHAGHRVHFAGCTFTALGGAGLDLEHGACENVVSGCRFTDISGSAIQVGDVTREDHHPSDPRRVVRANRVVNNRITRIGVEYQDSIGVFCGYTEGTEIAHNEIAQLPYTGISVGWGWGIPDAGGGAYQSPVAFDTPTTCRDNRIEYNHIHHVMQKRDDGGGVYTLSRQPGTVVRGNHIHDNGPGGPGGIYLDEGSAEIEVTGNLVYAVRRPMNFNNHSQNRIATCRVHDNRLGAVRPVPGVVGQAVHGDSLIEVPYAPALDAPALTVEAWVRVAEYPGGWDPRRWAVCKGANEWADTHYSLAIDRGNVRAYVNIGGGRENAHEAVSQDGPLPLNTWCQIAFTYDGDTLRVYCQGREVAATRVGKPRTTGPAGLCLAGRVDGYSVFESDLDEVRIYSRALSAAELQANAEAVRSAQPGRPPAVVQEGLAGAWGLDDQGVPADALGAITEAAGLERAYRGLLDDP